LRVLFDQGVPVPLRRLLEKHEVVTAFERGWHILSDNDLLASLEAEGFEVLVTTDQSLPYQQALNQRRFAVLVLTSTDWRLIRDYGARIAEAINTLAPGDCLRFVLPRRP
jgi:hypothetical protein